MSNNSANNKRIAKNTLMLYFRMLVTMGVSLYTSRITLSALGVDDYGIYNVVGGFVGMFTIISGSLSAAISRFITFHLGKGDQQRLNTVFSTSIIIQFALAAIIIILVESVGVWFLANKMVIPPDRMVAAQWVLQLSLLSLAIGMVSMPYDAAIIAHEKMSAFAYISLLDVFWKLLIAFLLIKSNSDRLILYASLLCGISLLMRLVYGLYCSKKFDECRNIKLVFDKDLFKEMFGFAGWNFFGSGSTLLMGQGVNILLNIFFGVVVNAGRGIASQIETVISRFVSNFTTALNPQITKSYASDDRQHMFTLMCAGAKYSYFLVLFFAVPVLFEAHTILVLWLKIVPEYTIEFLRISICILLLSVLSNTMVTAMLATGDIKKYQIIVGGLGMLIFPLSYVAFKLGAPPEAAYYVQFTVFVIQFICRLFLLRGMIGFPIRMYFNKVFRKVVVVSFIAVVLPLVIHYTYPSSDIIRLFLTGLASSISICCSIYLFGLGEEERAFVQNKVSAIKGKFC